LIGKRKYPGDRQARRMTLRRGSLLVVAGIAVATLMPTAQAFASVSLNTARAASGVRAQNARAIAKTALASNQASWFSGTVSGGGTQTWVWNNTNPSLVYVPALNPQGAATNNACQFQVTSTSYAQLPDGETEFVFGIQNTGTLACGTNIVLSWVPSTASFATGGINAGQTVIKAWNNNSNLASFEASLVPSGATSSDACQIQISNVTYTQVGSGGRSFQFDLTNTGNIACGATVLLANEQSTVISTNNLAPGASQNLTWFNAAADLSFIAGAEEVVDPSALLNVCDLQVSQPSYSEVIGPPAELEFHLTITNVGDLACTSEALLTSIS
jgi:hypothetical protein